MKTLKQILIGLGIFIAIIYLGICTLLYFYQEKLIFHPHAFSFNYKYNYPCTYNKRSAAAHFSSARETRARKPGVYSI